MTTQVEVLIKRNIFASEEEALHELVRDYFLRQITVLQWCASIRAQVRHEFSAIPSIPA